MATAFETAARHMDEEMIVPLRQVLIGRQLFGKQFKLPMGKFNVDVFRLSEMGPAAIQYAMPGPDITRDAVNMTAENAKIPWIAKGYEIKREDWNAFASQGIDLETASMLSAAQMCAEQEDDLLIQGWKPDGSAAKINGLYLAAGNDYSTSKDFATNGNPSDAVAGARSLIWEDKVFGCNFNLVLPPTQYNELDVSRNDNGIKEKPEVLDLLNPYPNAPKGQIFMSLDLDAGTGFISPVDTTGRLMDLVIGQDYENDMGVDSRSPKNSPVYGTIAGCVFPRIKQAVAIAKLSNI